MLGNVPACCWGCLFLVTARVGERVLIFLVPALSVPRSSRRPSSRALRLDPFRYTRSVFEIWNECFLFVLLYHYPNAKLPLLKMLSLAKINFAHTTKNLHEGLGGGDGGLDGDAELLVEDAGGGGGAEVVAADGLVRVLGPAEGGARLDGDDRLARLGQDGLLGVAVQVAFER
jgi:hypothetical protein